MIKKAGCVSITEDGVMANSFEFSGPYAIDESPSMDALLWARERVEQEIAKQKAAETSS